MGIKRHHDDSDVENGFGAVHHIIILSRFFSLLYNLRFPSSYKLNYHIFQ